MGEPRHDYSIRGCPEAGSEAGGAPG